MSRKTKVIIGSFIMFVLTAPAEAASMGGTSGGGGMGSRGGTSAGNGMGSSGGTHSTSAASGGMSAGTAASGAAGNASGMSNRSGNGNSDERKPPPIEPSNTEE